MTNQLSTIQFYGQSLITIEQDGKYYVALRPICDNIGLAWGAQYNRIKRDDVLNSVVFIMKTPSNGGNQQMLCLPIEYLNGWLFGIDTKRVRLELRDTLIRYKKECYQVLHDYWHKTGNYGNQEKLERASKMAAVVAAQVTHDTFKAFMQGKDEELGGRWLVYTHWQNGKPEVGASPIPGSAHIATLEELADRLTKDPNPFEKPEHFAKLANACLQRLAAKAQYLAAK